MSEFYDEVSMEWGSDNCLTESGYVQEECKKNEEEEGEESLNNEALLSRFDKFVNSCRSIPQLSHTEQMSLLREMNEIILFIRTIACDKEFSSLLLEISCDEDIIRLQKLRTSIRKRKELTHNKYLEAELLVKMAKAFLNKDGFFPENCVRITLTISAKFDEYSKHLNKLVESNLFLVLYIARKYTFHKTTMEIGDLFQVGVLGLVRGIKGFDISRGVKLSTYSIWWIRQHLARELGYMGSSFSLSENARHAYVKFYKERGMLATRLEREPTDNELRKALGWNETKYNRIKGIIPESWIKNINDTFDNGSTSNGKTLHEIIPSELPTPESSYQMTRNEELVLKILAEIEEENPTYAFVLRERYGFFGYTLTLRQVGNRLGVTRERARQIQVKAHQHFIRLLKKMSGERDMSLLKEMFL